MRVLHADDRLVVIDKPAGLLSVPGRSEPDCASARVQVLYPDALVVHRLDQATSGLLMFALGAEAQRQLSADFAERRVGKRYVAVVSGHMDGDGLIEVPVGADWPNRPRQQVDHQRGKASQTRWWALAHEGAHTRVVLEPLTGRTHQLRVHLAHLGHAILGDTLYAGADVAAASPRLLLHASELHIGELHFLCPPEF
ncbi:MULTISPECIES: RluA family pseudouridine synthase [unclassified Roseateles]|uniref:RluA family pseudouridine synthase n=1 Tax=unclassified Roseateles TaxID=2626991 RepID=UPI0006FE4B0E|nr:MULTISPECIES: pseudouridine synthase [unclassified Roseateles]KQW43457.1 RNA pseudouridine synthase [Pelomonas sp. Root405]KRA71195.1 RNA pseudouridine synthase [Pelomonas sp. Root662]